MEGHISLLLTIHPPLAYGVVDPIIFLDNWHTGNKIIEFCIAWYRFCKLTKYVCKSDNLFKFGTIFPSLPVLSGLPSFHDQTSVITFSILVYIFSGHVREVVPCHLLLAHVKAYRIASYHNCNSCLDLLVNFCPVSARPAEGINLAGSV